MSKCVGIDIGNDYAYVALAKDEGDEPVILAASDTDAAFSTHLWFSPERGELATRKPPETDAISLSLRWLLGRTHREAQACSSSTSWRPFLMPSNEPGAPARLEIATQEWTPEALFGIALHHIYQRICAHLADDAFGVVLTTTPEANDQQRQSLRDAAEMAGFEVHRIVYRPHAVCIAHGLMETEAATVALVCHFEDTRHNHTQIFAEDGILECLDTYSAPREETPERPIYGSPRESATHREWLHQQLLQRREQESVALQAEASYLQASGLQPNNATRHILLSGPAASHDWLAPLYEEIYAIAPTMDVTPAHAAALGACILSDIASHGAQELISIGVLPLTISLAINGHIVPLCLRNTTFPWQGKRTLFLVQIKRGAPKLTLVMGESERKDDNIGLTSFAIERHQSQSSCIIRAIDLALDIDFDESFSLSIREHLEPTTLFFEQRGPNLSFEQIARHLEHTRTPHISHTRETPGDAHQRFLSWVWLCQTLLERRDVPEADTLPLRQQLASLREQKYLCDATIGDWQQQSRTLEREYDALVAGID